MDVQYKIIGGDGCEYGPATLDELKAWIRDGRAAASTQTWRDDLSRWAPAATYSELADVLPAYVPPALPTAAAEPIPVGFGARFAAYLVDLIAVGLLFSLVWGVVSLVTGIKIPEFAPEKIPANLSEYWQAIMAYADQIRPVMLPYQLCAIGLRLLYDVFFNGRFGATPGKMVIGARIVRVDGSNLGYSRAFLRWAASRISDFTFGIGYLMVAVRGDKRALHDLLAGTKVIFKR